MSRCYMCPRLCGADRAAGETGYCASGELPTVAYASLHMWEEPCISGTRGSGTVFFSGCNLRCVYCQNRKISRSGVGTPMDTDALAEAFLERQRLGAHNVNLVTPTHFTRQIAEALRLARERGLTVPAVWNSSAYELPRELLALRGLVSVFLPDLRYVSPDLSTAFSGAPDYFERARAALDAMVSMAPRPVFGPDGMMLEGVIVRVLLLPGQVEEAKAAVRYLYGTYGDSIYISLMAQYTPVGDMGGYGELSRAVTEDEYAALVDCAVDLGVENGFTQEPGSASESFIPDFGY